MVRGKLYGRGQEPVCAGGPGRGLSEGRMTEAGAYTVDTAAVVRSTAELAHP